MNADRDQFEEAYSEFLDRHEYDEAENYLFSIVRLSFAAGWKAAGGDLPRSERTFEIFLAHEHDEPPAKS